MSSDVVQILIFAAIAVVVLWRLYAVLGKRVGRQPEDDPVAVTSNPATESEPAAPKALPAGDAAGLSAIKAREPSFDAAVFLEGAREAYQTIVRAFSAGDRDALKPLLAPAVGQSFEAAIAAREGEDRSQTTEFLHPPRADLDRIEVDGDVARARVRFLAELRTRSKGPEGEAVDDRRTAEIWTFERPVGASNPNWLLTRVEAAEA